MIIKLGQEIVKLFDTNTSVYDKQAIKNALRNLFEFKPGQAILEPTFGNELFRYLYEPLNNFSADKIGKTLHQMIGRWEPRIAIEDINIFPDETETVFQIVLKYSIPELKDFDSFDITLIK